MTSNEITHLGTTWCLCLPKRQAAVSEVDGDSTRVESQNRGEQIQISAGQTGACKSP